MKAIPNTVTAKCTQCGTPTDCTPTDTVLTDPGRSRVMRGKCSKCGSSVGCYQTQDSGLLGEAGMIWGGYWGSKTNG